MKKICKCGTEFETIHQRCVLCRPCRSLRDAARSKEYSRLKRLERGIAPRNLKNTVKKKKIIICKECGVEVECFSMARKFCDDCRYQRQIEFSRDSYLRRLEDNPEEVKQYHKDYYLKNIDKIKAYKTIYNEEYKEELARKRREKNAKIKEEKQLIKDEENRKKEKFQNFLKEREERLKPS